MYMYKIPPAPAAKNTSFLLSRHHDFKTEQISSGMLAVEEYPMSVPGPQDYIRSLASIVPFYNPNIPCVTPHLRELLAICRKSWIRDFLFTQEPTHLQAFTSPHNKSQATGCEIDTTRCTPPIVPNPYRVSSSSSIVFVPSFSIENISVGFGVEERSYSSTQSFFDLDTAGHFPNEVKRQIDTFRYIRDDRRGILILLYTQRNHFQFEFIVQQNTRARQRSTSEFERGSLLSLLYSDHELQDHMILRGLIRLQFVDEVRKCPFCNCAPNHDCACHFPVITARHPLDFSNHTDQMSSHTGSYQGAIHLMKYSNGNENGSVTLASSITIKCPGNPNLIDRLTEFIVARDSSKGQFDHISQPGSSFGIHQDSFSCSLPISSSMQPQGSDSNLPVQFQGHTEHGITTASFPNTNQSQGSATIHHEAMTAHMTQEEIEAQRQRERKIERKKERNRLSAQRSNMKKKRENDERKATLRMLRQRETELRARERQLREENLRIREQVFGVKPHGGGHR